jgi:hypothetical protein
MGRRTKVFLEYNRNHSDLWIYVVLLVYGPLSYNPPFPSPPKVRCWPPTFFGHIGLGLRACSSL